MEFVLKIPPLQRAFGRNDMFDAPLAYNVLSSCLHLSCHAWIVERAREGQNVFASTGVPGYLSVHLFNGAIDAAEFITNFDHRVSNHAWVEAE